MARHETAPASHVSGKLSELARHHERWMLVVRYWCLSERPPIFDVLVEKCGARPGVPLANASSHQFNEQIGARARQATRKQKKAAGTRSLNPPTARPVAD